MRDKYSITHIGLFNFMGNHKISNSESPIFGGDSACPPEPPLRFTMVLYYLLWNYRSKGMPKRRGRRHYVPETKKSVEKNIVRISAKPNNLQIFPKTC